MNDYNHQHRHSGIGYHTPVDVHTGRAAAVQNNANKFSTPPTNNTPNASTSRPAHPKSPTPPGSTNPRRPPWPSEQPDVSPPLTRTAARSTVTPPPHDVTMCKRCEGETVEAVHADLTDKIATHGFAIQQVADSSSGWTYSIGLHAGFGHPDLFCIDAEADLQATMVSRIGQAVVRGSSLPSLLAGLDATLVAVHENHLDDEWFASWKAIEGRSPRIGEVLQVVPGASWFCACHASSVRLFDQARPRQRASSRRARRRSNSSSRRLQLPPPR